MITRHVDDVTLQLQGVLFEHREGTFGDHANSTQVMEAVLKIGKQD